MPEIVLVRHGATEWSEAGKHTGRTDVPLLERGERAAAGLAKPLAQWHFGTVLVSPLQRARRTAELAGQLESDETDVDLLEWDYGSYDGLTTPEISERLGRPWSIWTDGARAAGGESAQDVAERATRVLARVTAASSDHDVLIVAHGHFLRVLATTWLGLEPQAGALFALSPGGLSALGHEHERRVVTRWNARTD